MNKEWSNYPKLDLKDTSFKNKGIYLLEIGDYCYVGKSNNQKGIRERIMQHLRELKKYFKSIEEFENEELDKIDAWKKVFNSGQFAGKHLYSKISLEMILSHLGFDDLNVYVLDANENKYDEQTLDNLEQEYIKEFDATWRGFNQLNVVTLAHGVFGYNNDPFSLEDIIHGMNEVKEYLQKPLTEKGFILKDWREYNVTNGLQSIQSLITKHLQTNNSLNKEFKTTLKSWIKDIKPLLPKYERSATMFEIMNFDDILEQKHSR